MGRSLYFTEWTGVRLEGAYAHGAANSFKQARVGLVKKMFSLLVIHTGRLVTTEQR